MLFPALLCALRETQSLFFLWVQGIFRIIPIDQKKQKSMARGMKRNAMKQTKQKKTPMKAARAGRRQDEFSDVSSSPGDGGADKGLLHAGDETFLFAAGSGGVAAAVEKLAGEIQKLSVDLEPPVGVLEPG